MSAADVSDAFSDALQDDDAAKLYDNAPCGYLSTTAEGLIVKANQTLLQMLGYRADQLVGQRVFSDLLSAGGRIYYETHYSPMLQMNGVAREIAVDLVRADGTRVPVLITAVLDRGPDGRPETVRVAVFDATERRRYERELLEAKRRAEQSEAHARSLAATLQQTLIPPAPPVVDGLAVAAAYRPAGDGAEVGGDFYDMFQVKDEEWVLVIGDVCGKGVGAAVVTALARHTLRAAAMRHPRASDALHELNRTLLADEAARYCTAAVVRLARDGDAWLGSVSLSGHPAPLHRLRDGAVEPVGRFGSLSGALPDPEFHDVEVRLEPGDALVLYTDGVTESRGGDEFFGETRLRQSVASGGGVPQHIVSALVGEVLAFSGGRPRDDLAVVAVSPSPGAAEVPK